MIHKTNNNNKLPLVLALALASCEPEDLTTPQYQAKYYAMTIKTAVHDAYLNCYALSGDEKKQCQDPIIRQYIDAKWQNDQEYLEAFQSEAEKRGFVHFLNALNLKCEKLKKHPEFIEGKQAYFVQCRPKRQYWMQFDYETKKWKLLKENDKK